MSVQVNPSSARGARSTANTLPWWRVALPVALRALNRVATALTISEWAFAALVFFCYIYFVTPAGTNTISRYDMVYALAHGGANIDLHASNTIDVSYFHGHWYSPRSLGLSLVAVPVLFVIGHFFDLDNYAQLTITQQIALLNAFTLAPAAVAGALALRRFVARLRPTLANSPLPYVVAGMFALGTLAYPFSTTLFSHMFGGALIFVAFYLIFRARQVERPTWRLVVAGLLTGLAVISEYPAGVILLLLCAYIWFGFPGRRIQTLVLFGVGIAPSALALAAYNWWAFGNPLSLSYGFVSGSEFQGQHSGFFGITLPKPDGLWQILVYPRGLLIESPFLVLIPLGLYRWYRQHGDYHLEALVAIAVSVIYPLMISSYFLPMAGENLPGPRLLTPALAFACLGLIWVVDDPRAWLRRSLVVALGFSLVMSYLYEATGVRIYHNYGAYPLTDLFWPTISTGFVPIRDGPTPDTLGSAWLHLPLTWSLLLGAIPIALWFYAAARALLRRDPGPEVATQSDASLALPYPNDELRPLPELAASR
ncbi:MAG: hypothetical protein ACHQ1E_11085 [Ktedonobacterales bacterium]|jgi:hypothetical protein